MSRDLQTAEGRALATAMLAGLAAINAVGFVAEWVTRGDRVVCVLHWSATQRDGGCAESRPEALALTCEGLAEVASCEGRHADAVALRRLAGRIRDAVRALSAAALAPTIPPPPEGTRAA